ncbi:hypothetical protein HK100_000041 [Physocladia obscura]|uniref:Uncharacterized protein n=1 Tax=Physocladia obscura TaxID=109957 RepID=A0AAD5XLU1_9FUNG|nr:hypothetical protein HK100_000041 [Physocladia obscura]
MDFRTTIGNMWSRHRSLKVKPQPVETLSGSASPLMVSVVAVTSTAATADRAKKLKTPTSTPEPTTTPTAATAATATATTTTATTTLSVPLPITTNNDVFASSSTAEPVRQFGVEHGRLPNIYYDNADYHQQQQFPPLRRESITKQMERMRAADAFPVLRTEEMLYQGFPHNPTADAPPAVASTSPTTFCRDADPMDLKLLLDIYDGPSLPPPYSVVQQHQHMYNEFESTRLFLIRVSYDKRMERDRAFAQKVGFGGGVMALLKLEKLYYAEI